MIFFSLLFALLLEQLYPLPVGRAVWQTWEQLADWALDNLDAGSARHGWVAWSVAVAVPALAAALLYVLLRAVGWPLALLANIVVLYLTLGFRQFGQHITAIRDALDAGDTMRASALLAQWRGSGRAALPRSELTQQILEHAALDVQRHVFGVMIAFVLFAVLGLGPTGAVLYSLTDLVAQQWRQRQHETGMASGHALHAAQAAWNVVNWLPARATAAAFAVVGNFEQAVDNWRQVGDAPLAHPGHSQSDAVVLAVAAGAIDMAGSFGADAAPPTTSGLGNGQRPSGTAYASEDPTWFEPSAPPAWPHPAAVPVPTAHAQHVHMLVRLVWRAVLLWAGLIALVTLTHWVS